MVEVRHHLLQLALGHLPVADADARLRGQRRHRLRRLVDAAHPVVDIEDLAAAHQLPVQRLADDVVALLVNEGVDGKALGRRRGDDGEVAHAGQRHVQGAGNGRGGQGKHVRLRPQRLQPLLLPHAEAVLLVDDDQAQVLEIQPGAEQPVGADEDVDGTLGQALADGLDLAGAAQPGGQVNMHRPVRKAVAESLQVLLRQQGGGGQHRHLLAALHRREGGPHGHLGLAEAHIAADQPVGGFAGSEVGEHRIHRLGLVGGQLEGKLGGETFVLSLLATQLGGRTGGPAGEHIK